MMRCLVLLNFLALCLPGCCCDAPPERRFVPTSTVVAVGPQPTTLWEFQSAEQQGYLVAATGRGVAFGWGDERIRLTDGEPLHVLRVDARSGEVLVKRLDCNSLARLSADGLEVRDSSFGR